ncbi:ATPase [Jannaschia sp. S6380]|uniref:ATPase n=1 Tax=Jannaschia sp. S6380 TaxID=2926408 RepID=UPI001FF2E22E|nr:ATPase [Jannaschia sp. S6380]MCK0166919.1 ATPase [Jannaschia sp. S6380]
MIYATEQDWRTARDKRVTFFGMSGLGKTHMARILRGAGDWFHYSIDYRIGTAYMGEHINDNLKREAMRVPFLAGLLRSDSIYIGSNITFENLDPLSTYLGQPGDPAQGGLPMPEYERRQTLHVRAEINALLDTPHFIERARDIYGYDQFVCDTGGSICEVVDPHDPADPALRALHDTTLMVWIEGTEDHVQTLVDRFSSAPKPMCYRPEFLTEQWRDYLRVSGVSADRVDPNAFARHAYAAAITERHPRYAAMAANWGISVTAAEVAAVRDAADVIALVGEALGRHRAAA